MSSLTEQMQRWLDARRPAPCRAAASAPAMELPFSAEHPMTLDDLAQSLRGLPRTAILMVETPDGLRELNLVRPVHLSADGTAIGGASSGARYALVLVHEPGRRTSRDAIAAT